MSVVRKLWWAAPLWLWLSSSTQAAPPETLTQVAVHPTDQTRMVLRYYESGEGLIYTDDAGASWRALCASAIDPVEGSPPIRLGRIAISNDGSLFMGTYTSMLEDEGATGCTWREVSRFTGEWVTDVTHDPTDADVLYALLSTTPNGENGVLKRTGDGAWELVGSTDDLLLNRLHVVERAPGELRFYAAGSRGILGEPPNTRPNYVTRVSDDMGETWTEHEFGDTETEIELVGVDPTNPDRIVVASTYDRASGSTGLPDDAVLVSTDGGETFTEYLTMTSFGGLAFAPDGRLWIGDKGDTFDVDLPSGLYYAASLDEAATKVNDTLQVSCVHYLSDADGVFVCQRFEAGSVMTDGSGYAKRFDFRETESFVDCPCQDLVAACRDQMLSGWCGASHFPEAPMCCPYPDRVTMDPNILPGETPTLAIDCPDEPPPAFTPDPSCAPTGGGGTGGAAGTAASGGTGGSSGTGAAGGGVPPVVTVDGGVAPDGGEGSDDSGDDGCSCRAPGHRGERPHGAWLAALPVVALLWWRRRAWR